MKLGITAVFDHVRNSSGDGLGMEFGKLEAPALLKRRATVQPQETTARWGYESGVNRFVKEKPEIHDFT